MAEKAKNKNPLVGSQAKATTLDKSLKIDIDTDKVLVDNIIQAGLSGGLNVGTIEDFTSISNSRDSIYQLIDTMMEDSAVSAIVKTYTEEACKPADNGHVVWCESDDPKVSKFVNYLLNVANVDKKIYGWTNCLIKYGDCYLKLFRESDYKDLIFKPKIVDEVASTHTRLTEEKLNEDVSLNVHKTGDRYSYYIEMVPNPGTMFELTKFGKTYGFVETPDQKNSLSYLNNYFGGSPTANGSVAANPAMYRMKSNDVNIYQADDYVHAYLEDNVTRYPETVDLFVDEADYRSNTNGQSYQVRRGQSLLYDKYKVWRQKTLLENAILLNRITRSSVVRNIQVEVGDMPKSKVQATLRHVKELFEQKSSINAGSSMSEYTNPGPIENNIYTATHDGKGAITVTAVGGDVDVKNIADLDKWVNKFYGAFGIPKQYFSETDEGGGFNGGTALSITSSVFATKVRQIQNAMIQAITDAVNLFLINRGVNSYLNRFTIKMNAPLTQEEISYRENLSSRITAISNMQALFGAVEDKERQLEILKCLVSTLNYGDNLNQIIDEEIKAVRAAAKEEAEKAEAEKKLEQEEAAEETAAESTSEETPEETSSEEASEELPPIDLTEDMSLNNMIESSLMTEDLPTPNELDEKIDFSENK